jgi:hypothetical protein
MPKTYSACERISNFEKQTSAPYLRTLMGPSDSTADGVNVNSGWCELVPALAEAGNAILKLVALRPTAETGHEMPVRKASLNRNPLHDVR